MRRDAKSAGATSTSAHDAARANDARALAIALANDPTLLDRVDALRRTPLHLAAHVDGVEAIELLCDRGARVSAEAMDGFTAFHFACARGNVAAAKALARRGANARAMTYKSENALHLALSANAGVDLIKFLVKKRVNALGVSKKGKSVLECCRADCAAETRDVVERAAAEAKAKDGDGDVEGASEGGDGGADVGPSIGPSIGPSMGPSIGPSMGPSARPTSGKVNRDAIAVVDDEGEEKDQGASKNKKQKTKIGAMSFGEDDE